MIIVKAQPGDTSDSLIRKFTRKVISEGILLELKKKRILSKTGRKEKRAKERNTAKNKIPQISRQSLKMVNVLIKSESRYPVSRKMIKETVERVLLEKKIKRDIEVSINIVGDRLMKGLNKKYRNIDETTDVLSFPLSEAQGNSPFVDAPDGILRLGDIIVSYPQAVLEAIDEEKLVDQKVGELVEHGLLHLLGYHHE